MTAQRLPFVTCPVCGEQRETPKNYLRTSAAKRNRPCRRCSQIKHGMSRTRLYREWTSMKGRCGLTKCSNPSAIKHYIERGISVCDEWRSFPAFAAWSAAHGYADRLTLDRENSTLGYSPDNCRWVTMTENLRSRDDRLLKMEDARELRRLHAAGVGRKELAKMFGISRLHAANVYKHRRWREDAA